MVAKKGAGFFSSIIGGIKKLAAPLLQGVGTALTGVLDSGKKQAAAVATRAVQRAAEGATTAIQTGNIRGAARQVASQTSRDVMGTARREFDQGRDTMRREATRQVGSYHRRFAQGARRHYGQYRGHQGWGQMGMRPPTFNSMYGAGFGKKHFKKLEREAHKHINKIYAHAKKQAAAGHKHVRKNGRRSAAATKREVKRGIAAVHKESKGGMIASVRAVKALMADEIKRKTLKKKGGGMSVGAGTKVGAGGRKKGGLLIDPDIKRWQGTAPWTRMRLPVAVETKERKKRKKKGAGTSVGAGVFKALSRKYIEAGKNKRKKKRVVAATKRKRVLPPDYYSTSMPLPG